MAGRPCPHYHEAVADFTKALHLNNPPTRLYFMRAVVWDKLGRHARPLAWADRTEGMKCEPADESRIEIRRATLLGKCR